MLLCGWRFRPVFLSLDFWNFVVELLSCLRVCKLEPFFKDSLSWSCSLFSSRIFQNSSLWRSIMLILKIQPSKRSASYVDSSETSLSTYELTKGKRSTLTLSFGSTFHRRPVRSSLWKPSPSVSIKSTNFEDGRTPSFLLSILSNILRRLWQNLNQEVHLRHLPNILSQSFCLYCPVDDEGVLPVTHH